MKGAIAAAAVAAMASGANAHGHRHAHELFAAKRNVETCKPGCTTHWSTITGEPTLLPHVPSTTFTPAPEPTTSSVEVPLPSDNPITCPTPGTYTIPATTITVSESTTVCVPTTTHVVPGTHTVGGVTTIVETATTITCPVATTVTEGGVVHSTISSTVYVCPSSGTYTIAPITTTVTEECDIEYPVPTSYLPGTYTAPELIITVTETGYVTVCPYTSSGLVTALPEPTKVPEVPAPAPTVYAVPKPEAPKPEAPKPETPKPEAPKPKPEAPKPETPVYQPPKEDKPKPKPSKVPTGHFDGSLGSNGDHYGITYTPYDGQTGDCKSASQVDSDIAEIKGDGFDVVRVYSTDCDTLPFVGDACKKHGVQMIIGVFVKETGCSYETKEIKEQIDGIAEWAQWEQVKLFVIGNEAIMNGYCSAQQLRTLVETVKSKCSAYTGPFTIAETLNVWQQPEVSKAICDVVDYTGANIHPYFNFEVTPESAGKFVQGQLDLLDEICPGKTSFNLECGWPTEGNCHGTACPGKDAQITALKSIRDTCGGKTIFFSFENDMWKEDGDCLCEKSWGSKACFASF